MEGVSPCVDEFTQGSLTLKQGGFAPAVQATALSAGRPGTNSAAKRLAIEA